MADNIIYFLRLHAVRERVLAHSVTFKARVEAESDDVAARANGAVEVCVLTRHSLCAALAHDVRGTIQQYAGHRAVRFNSFGPEHRRHHLHHG